MTDILTRLAALTEKNDNGLLPCTFSGKDALPFFDAGGHGAKCTAFHCLCGRIRFKTRGDLLQWWNNRPREEALIALVQDAAGEIERLRDALRVSQAAIQHVRPLIQKAGVPPLARKIGIMSSIATSGAHKLTFALKEMEKALNPQETAND